MTRQIAEFLVFGLLTPLVVVQGLFLGLDFLDAVTRIPKGQGTILRSTILLTFVMALFAGLAGAWALVEWAVKPSASSSAVRRIKTIILGLAAIAPPAFVARKGLNYDQIVSGSMTPWLLAFMALVAWLSRAVAIKSAERPLRMAFVAYATVVVLMTLANLGAFACTTDDAGYSECRDHEPSPERLFRNIVAYGLAAVAGVYSAVKWPAAKR